jgi:hypothetical protein
MDDIKFVPRRFFSILDGSGDVTDKKQETIALAPRRWVAMLDILGFGAINQVMKPQDLIFLYNDVLGLLVDKHVSETALVSTIKPKEGSGIEFPVEPCRVIKFSDTLLFYSDNDSEGSLCGIVMAVAHVIATSIAIGLPLRGGITLGEAAMDKDANVYVGDAIITAYGLESSLKWAGAVIDCPSLYEDYGEVLKQLEAYGLILTAAAPMKNKHPKRKSGDNEWKETPCVGWPLAIAGQSNLVRSKMASLVKPSDEISQEYHDHTIAFYDEYRASRQSEDGRALDTVSIGFPTKNWLEISDHFPMSDPNK